MDASSVAAVATTSSRKRRAESQEVVDEDSGAVVQPASAAAAVADSDASVMIYVGQKRQRGVTGQRNVMHEGVLNIDVTSGSGNKVGGHKATSFSPFLLPVYDDAGKLVTVAFELCWQSRKAWKKAGHIQVNADGSWTPTAAWYAFRAKSLALKKGKRRLFPKAYGPADCAFIDGKRVDYVPSRSLEYVPKYGELVRNLPIMDELEKLVKGRQPVMLLDGDGPPRHLYPNGMPLTPANWTRMLRDGAFPFGHSYVAALELFKRCFPGKWQTVDGL
jgi:hypothetical protein